MAPIAPGRNGWKALCGLPSRSQRTGWKARHAATAPADLDGRPCMANHRDKALRVAAGHSPPRSPWVCNNGPTVTHMPMPHLLGVPRLSPAHHATCVHSLRQLDVRLSESDDPDLEPTSWSPAPTASTSPEAKLRQLVQVLLPGVPRCPPCSAADVAQCRPALAASPVLELFRCPGGLAPSKPPAVPAPCGERSATPGPVWGPGLSRPHCAHPALELQRPLRPLLPAAL